MKINFNLQHEALYGLQDIVKMKNLFTKLCGVGSLIGIVGMTIIAFGSREKIDVYDFYYHGKPSMIVQEKVWWSNDIYYMIVEGNKSRGQIIGDRGEMISVEGRGYGVDDQKGYKINIGRQNE